MNESVPAPENLWARLALLSECCHVVVQNRTGPGDFLSWEVTITPKSRTKGVYTKSASLIDALVQAVDQADGLGFRD